MLYNCRVYDYPVGQHVTIYTKSILDKGEKNENFRRDYVNENRTVEQEKHCISQSLNTTKNKIYNIARSNVWEWFITLTFDREKVDSSNYELVTCKLTKFLNNLRNRKAPDLIYLIVPELHSDKKHYHFHGLLSNCGKMMFWNSGHKDQSGNIIYNMPDWSFGFTTATRVQDTQRVSFYITKYITKDMIYQLKSKKRYYTSRNVNVTKGEKYLIDPEQFKEFYADSISYVKSINIPEAGQMVTYFELE